MFEEKKRQRGREELRRKQGMPDVEGFRVFPAGTTYFSHTPYHTRNPGNILLYYPTSSEAGNKLLLLESTLYCALTSS